MLFDRLEFQLFELFGVLTDRERRISENVELEADDFETPIIKWIGNKKVLSTAVSKESRLNELSASAKKN